MFCDTVSSKDAIGNIKCSALVYIFNRRILIVAVTTLIAECNNFFGCIAHVQLDKLFA